jgi:hypothetical protein
MLALGGTLLMSLIVAAVILSSASPHTGRQDRSHHWSRINAVSELGSEVRNVISLDGNSLIWNGAPISEANLRQFLAVTTQMSPQPTLVLSYSAQTKSARIAAIRSLIEDVLQCTPSNCREVARTPAG